MLGEPRHLQERRQALSVEKLLPESVRKFLLEHIQSVNWHREGVADTTAPDFRFHSNQTFWHTMLKSRQAALNWVELSLFQIVDWFPRTPGLYHTSNAQGERRRAESAARVENGIRFYNPSGKGCMINGGIGSVRFKPIVIQNEDCWLCTATSDGVCHSGIPLAIPSHLMRKVNPERSCFYNIVGQVKFLPVFFEHYFRHMTRIPQIYVLVENIEQRSDSEPEVPVEITPLVFFHSESRREYGSYKVTYVRCSSKSYEKLDRAIDWLVWYVRRYNGKIVTNFDQQRPLFADAPFSLQNVMEGGIDRYQLIKYHIEQADLVCNEVREIHAGRITMSSIKVEIGDGNIFYGSVVVAEKIKNSFNKAEKANIPHDLKELLKKLAIAVGKMSEELPKDEAERAARDLEALTAEATSEEPRRRWWELSIDGLKQAAKIAGEIGVPVIRLASAVAAMLLDLQ